jgi:type VI secretion system secreted protein Hcp
MPVHVHVWMKGQKSGDITGDCTIVGREGSIEVIQFDSGVRAPRDQHTGMPTGQRVHYPMVLTKAMDRSSPLLYQMLCQNENLTEVTLKLYEADPSGGEKERFNIKLENAHLAEVKSFMPNTKENEGEQYAYNETVSLVYEKITWEDLDYRVMATDEWGVREMA